MQVEDLVRVPCESALNAEQLTKFERFAQEVAAVDGAQAFSEQTLIALRHAAHRQVATARLFYFLDEALNVMGAWVLVVPDAGVPGVIEGAVHPAHRGQGIASALLKELVQGLLSHEELGHYTVWVHQATNDPHGNIAAAAHHLTQRFGFSPVRELHKMAVFLTDDSRERIRLAAQQTPLPAGITLRTFASGDELAWLTLNAAAFAHHPEQGKLTRSDLDERIGSDWFDAKGFFIADAPNGLAGYHWTKIPVPAEDPAEGEVYAVGVSPAWQGKKLGQVLTLAGMHYLSETSTPDGTKLERIVLYVDAENLAALTLYQKLGFTDLSVDRMYIHA